MLCQICGLRINGKYQCNVLGDAFCAHHREVVQCGACLRFCAAPDAAESRFCPTCSKQAVRNDVELGRHVDSVVAWLSAVLGRNSLGSIPVSLGEDSIFQENCQGMTNWTSDGRSVRAEVFIRQGLPSLRCNQVIAHEFGHILLVADPVNFQFTGGLDVTQSLEEEGFCEVVGYLCTADFPHPDRDRQLLGIQGNTDSIYGDGFRAIWSRYQQLGSILAVRSELLGRSVTPYPVLGVATPSGLADTAAPPRFPVSELPSGGIEIRGGTHRPSITWGEGRPDRNQPDRSPQKAPTDRPSISWN